MRLPEWSDPDRRDAALLRVAQRLGEADPLSHNELAVLFLLSHGVPRAVVAEWLHISLYAVGQAVTKARAKLLAQSTAHAVATALRLGLIS